MTNLNICSNIMSIVVILMIATTTTTIADSFNNFYHNNNNNNGAAAIMPDNPLSVDSQRDRNRDSMLCMDIRPQHSVNIQHITGQWYGSEIIMHTQDVPGVFRYDSCVIIYLNDVTAQMRGFTYNYNNREGYRQGASTSLDIPAATSYEDKQRSIETKYLRLIWSEKDDNLEYTFNYTDNSPGYWMNVGEQRGSLVSLNHYTQFTGTVQVVKAVNDHLVLTFCGNDVRSSIYTIVLSRNSHGLKTDELRSIRNLLARRGLSTDTIRQVCQSTGERFKASTKIIAVMLAFLMIFKFSK